MTKAYKALPPAELLWEHFDLDLWTGRLLRKPIKGLAVKRNPFGRLSTKGYIYGMFQGGTYYAHRLVWVWCTGTDPKPFEVDHIDRHRSNNCYLNLRLVHASEQARNTNTYKNNRLGVKGVRKVVGTQRYAARIRVNGVLIHLGCYSTIQDASAAYNKAAIEHFGHLASCSS